MLKQSAIRSERFKQMPSPSHAAPKGLRAAIDLMGTPIRFTRNAEIYGENEPADYLYKVVSGTVRTFKVRVDGHRQIGGFYLPGDIFGTQVGQEHTFSAEAISDCQVLLISRRSVMAIAAWNSAVARELWTLMGRELEHAQDHILLLIKSAQERVASFLLEMAGQASSGNTIELPMTRQDIGDYLGLTIETVSRTLAHLEATATIEVHSRQIVLRDRATLRRLNA